MKNPSTEAPGAKRKSAKPISFRPDEEVYQVLEEQAQAMNCSIHELACHYLTKTICKEADDGVTPEEIVRELVELREDLAVGVEALLASAGKASAEEAREWADTNLRK